MSDIQGLIFQKAADLSETTTLVVFAMGLLCTLQGFRFARFIIALICAVWGWIAGGVVASIVGLPVAFGSVVAVALCALALMRFRAGLAIASAFTGGALAWHMAAQFGLRLDSLPIVAAIGLAAGFSLLWVCPRYLPILTTTVNGAWLLIAAFVGLTSGLAPSLGATFCDWAASYPLMTPAFMLMLFVLGYSVQANARQGDMETGGAPGARELERIS